MVSDQSFESSFTIDTDFVSSYGMDINYPFINQVLEDIFLYGHRKSIRRETIRERFCDRNVSSIGGFEMACVRIVGEWQDYHRSPLSRRIKTRALRGHSGFRRLFGRNQPVSMQEFQ
jgi:hypothetical protein